MHNTKRTALYARVSTTGQNVENQLIALRATARARGWAYVEYKDVISGAAAARPEFDRMMSAVAAGKVTHVAAWDVSRLGRSLKGLTIFLETLLKKNCDLFLAQQGLDTTTPAGQAMFGMISVFSEFERNIIRARVLAGLERARARGQRLGRPPLSHEKKNMVLKLRKEGLSFAKISKAARCSKTAARTVSQEVNNV